MDMSVYNNFKLHFIISHIPKIKGSYEKLVDVEEILFKLVIKVQRKTGKKMSSDKPLFKRTPTIFASRRATRKRFEIIASPFRGEFIGPRGARLTKVSRKMLGSVKLNIIYDICFSNSLIIHELMTQSGCMN